MAHNFKVPLSTCSASVGLFLFPPGVENPPYIKNTDGIVFFLDYSLHLQISLDLATCQSVKAGSLLWNMD
jgi:hypothetical protein